MSTPANDPILSAATQAQSRGLTPVTLLPRQKRPATQGWADSTYDTARKFRAVYGKVARKYPTQQMNLGLALGAKHGGLIDIDLDHHKALRIARDILPSTAMRSGHPGRPGSHYWYVIDGFDPGLRQFELPDGSMIVEFRANGGQTAVPPSVHPSGERYAWYGDAWGGDEGPKRLDAEQGKQLFAKVMSIALAVALADKWPSKGSRHSAYLALVGGLLRDEDEDGLPQIHGMWDQNIEFIIRMLVSLTNDADGPTSRIAESVASTRKKILRGAKVQGWPTLARIIGEPHVTTARKIIEEIEDLAGEHRQKRSKRSESADAWEDPGKPALSLVSEGATGETREDREVRLAQLDPEDRKPLEERENEWERVDMGPYLRGKAKPPEPAFLFRDDGPGMLYPGRVNMLYGEGGSGKTLIALDMARRVMERGEKVMLVDLEDEPINTIHRLHQMDLDDEIIGSDRFTYLHPERMPLAVMEVDRFGEHKVSQRGEASQTVLANVLDKINPTLIIIDGTTTLYRIHGLDSNSVAGADMVGGWLRDLTNGYTRTVLMIDHTPKNASPTSGPIGSQHKIAMVQGIALRVNATIKPRRGLVGKAALIIGKDRLGAVIEQATQSDPPVVAEVQFDSTGEHLKISYGVPSVGSSALVTVTGQKPPGRKPLINLKDRDRLMDALSTLKTWIGRAEWFFAAGLKDLSPSTQRRIIDDLLDPDAPQIEKSGDSARTTKYRALFDTDGTAMDRD